VDFPENESPTRHSYKGRRKSSNFDMLSDPLKYQDYVKEYLDGIDEEEEKTGTSKQAVTKYRKRTRSSNFFSLSNN
jgi:hypothetical protein